MLRFTLAILFFSSSILFGQTTVSDSFIFDGEDRSYRIYIPAIYDADVPVPLIFNLHGYGSTNVEQEAYGDFRPIADTANFIIVHPQGLVDDAGSTHWNNFATSSVDDIGFINALLDTLIANYSINTNRVYSTGMSNGGFMSYELACQLSHRITAVASVTGSMTYLMETNCSAGHPTPILQIHGTADAVVPYDGNIACIAIEDLVENWVEFNHCSDEPTVLEFPDIDPDDGCTATHFIYEDGWLGSSVEFIRINDGGHTWPGAPIDITTTNHDFNASVEIWRFFQQFELNKLTSSVEEIEEKNEIYAYPNPSQNGNFNINLGDHTGLNLTLYDAKGKLIKTFYTQKDEFEISVNSKGLFFLQVQGEKIDYTLSLVVE